MKDLFQSILCASPKNLPGVKRIYFTITFLLTALTLLNAKEPDKSNVAANKNLQSLQAGWDNPTRTYRPHTRWWWPGNALTKADPKIYRQSNIAQKDMTQTDLPPSGLMGPVQIFWKEKQ